MYLVHYIEFSVRFLLTTFKEGYGYTVALCYNVMKCTECIVTKTIVITEEYNVMVFQ